MLRRCITVLILSFSMLAFTTAQGEMTISASTNLDTLDYDLDSIHFKLEKLETLWHLSPSGDGKLFVERLRARRLLITMRGNSKKTGGSALPNRITLPFPIKVQQAEIAQVIVVTSTGRHILNNVQLDLEADAKTIRLNTLRSDTDFGKTEVALNMSTVNPFKLSGAVSIKQVMSSTYDRLSYDVKTNLSGNLKELHFESSALLTRQGDHLAIIQSDNKSSDPAAHITVKGEIGLLNDYPLTVNAQIIKLRPELLGNYPSAKLNFDLNLQSKLGSNDSSQAALQVQFSSWDSHWQDQVLSSVGKVTIAGTQIRNIDFQAEIARNTVKASGSLGVVDSYLEWRAELPSLSAFGAQFSGEAHANGTLAGSLDNLALRFNLLAQKLHLPGDINVNKIEGQATLKEGELGKFEANMKANGLQIAKSPVLDVSLNLQGTRAAHQLLIKAQSQPKIHANSQGKVLQFQSILQGGLVSDHWRGQIENLVYKGETLMTLEAPAALNCGRDNLTIANAVLQMATGRVYIDALNIDSKGFSSKGHLTQVALDDLPQVLLTLPSRLQGNLIFSGKWDIDAYKTLNGSISLWREAGDLVMTNVDGTTKLLGLQEVKGGVQFHDNNADFTLHLTGQQLGSLDTHLTTTLTRVDSGFSLMANAPLTLTSTAQLNTLAWLPLPPSLMDASPDGELTIFVQGNGTILKPNLRGNVMGKNLQLTLPSRGIALTNGTLEANFENNQLRITQALWKAGEGYLRTNGVMLMENKQPRVDLDWTADKFTVISGADRLLILSGSGKTALAQDMLSISGNFTVEKGLIELTDEDTPTLDDDVIVLGRTESLLEPRLKVLLNRLRIDLGENFILRGRGLDAELSGSVALSGLTQYSPHTEGSIKVKKGTYMAYGQVLNIERGILNFSGPVDNPGLNIRAMRNGRSVSAADITETSFLPVNTGERMTESSSSAASSGAGVTGSGFQTVNAGVEITGSAFQPTIKLVSDPSVPDTEKLSWLMLGHGMDQARKNDFSMLLRAAGVMLTQGQSVPLQTQLARAAGLDEINLSGVNAESASFTFGKRLSSQLYLSYEKSISGLLDVARLTFNITPRWTLQTEAGTESAVDALYTFSFK